MRKNKYLTPWTNSMLIFCNLCGLPAVLVVATRLQVAGLQWGDQSGMIGLTWRRCSLPLLLPAGRNIGQHRCQTVFRLGVKVCAHFGRDVGPLLPADSLQII